MRVLRRSLADAGRAQGVVVVIDVLRSFSTAAYGLAAGARRVVPAADEVHAELLRARNDPALTVGAAPGGQALPTLDLLNSPSALMGLPLAGVSLIQVTAGGIRALLAAAHAPLLFAASLVVASATARQVAMLHPSTVTLITTGQWQDRDGDEDLACADLIEAYLSGRAPDVQAFERRVMASDFGRRFGEAPHLPLADLRLCAAANRFDFAMPLLRRADGSLHLLALS